MKTFSFMSTPDKILTRKSYLLNLDFLNQKISSECSLPEENVSNLRKELSRLQILIETLDTELLTE